MSSQLVASSRSFAWWLVAVVAGGPALLPAAPSRASERAAVERTVVEGAARLTLSIDRAEFLLGENVLVHYCLTNIGVEPLEIEVGSDYRFVDRHMRFRITVEAEDGTPLPAPEPATGSGGGLGWSPHLARGESYCQSLPLVRYVRIDGPGTYTVRVIHDLGWSDGIGRKAPTGELTVLFRMPDPATAARLVDEMLALPAESKTSPPQRDTPWGDPRALRYPVYAEPLLAVAERGEPRAAIALGEVPSTAATAALLKLAVGADRDVARAAVSALTWRLPDPVLAGGLPSRNVFASPESTRRGYLIKSGWREEYVWATRELARRLLAAPAVEDVAAGAFILQCVGEPADLPPLTDALTVAVERAQHEAPEKGIYPRPHGAAQELVRAAEMLLARGALPPPAPRSPGGWAVYFVQARRDPAFLASVTPATWEAVLRGPSSYLRQLALESVAAAPPAVVRALLPALMEDPDLDIRIESCRVAGRSHDPELVPLLVAILRSASDFRLLSTAFNAAHELGAYYEALQVAAERLPEKDQFGDMIGYLAGIVDGSKGFGADYQQAAPVLVATSGHWQRFLREHRADIARGERFAIGDPRLTPELFPPGFHFWTADGKQWP